MFKLVVLWDNDSELHVFFYETYTAVDSFTVIITYGNWLYSLLVVTQILPSTRKTCLS